MSGIEVVGLLASLSQLTSYGIKITISIKDIYQRVQNAPQKIQEHAQQIRQLINIATTIKRHTFLHHKEVEIHVEATLGQAKSLKNTLDDIQSEYLRGSVRKYWNILRKSQEKEILASFERLEKEKSALQLCISFNHTILLGNIQNSIDELHEISGAVMFGGKKKKQSGRSVSYLIGTPASERVN